MAASKKSCKGLRTPRRIGKTFEYMPSSIREQLTIPCPDKDNLLSEIMWCQNKDKADKALKTGFIQGIQSGLLDPTDYGKYTVQDAVYCYQATEYLKTAKAKAKLKQDELMLEFLTARVESYKEYTEEMFKDWHIKEPYAIQLGVAARAYTEFERNVAVNEEPFYLLIAMLPCENLWKWLAKEIKSGIGETNVYSFWIEENLDEGIGTLASFVDRNAKKYNCDQSKAEKIYSRGMEGEVNFFHSATIDIDNTE